MVWVPNPFVVLLEFLRIHCVGLRIARDVEIEGHPEIVQIDCSDPFWMCYGGIESKLRGWWWRRMLLLRFVIVNSMSSGVVTNSNVRGRSRISDLWRLSGDWNVISDWSGSVGT